VSNWHPWAYQRERTFDTAKSDMTAEGGQSSNQFDIVYLGAENLLEGIFSRSQAIAIELARSFRVLYVNLDCYSLPHVICDWCFRRNSRRRPGVRPIRANLWTADLVTLIPSLVTLPSNRIRTWTAAQHLRRAIRQLGFRSDILWTGLPWTVSMVKHIPASLVCYDCMDDFSLMFQGRSRRIFQALDSKLLQISDLVIASSEELYAKCGKVNANVHLVRNGVAVNLYSGDGTVPPSDLQNIRRPILGYIGHIAHWADLELMKALATRYPRCSLVIVGRVGVSVKQLSNLPNVHFLGFKPFAEVPHYVREFDVCLIPFRVNDLTVAVNPIKFYEYCAAGKPIVSVALPELEPFRRLCYLARSHDEFLDAVAAALEEPKDPHGAKLAIDRRKVADESSWELRGTEVRTILLKSIERKLTPSLQEWPVNKGQT
jgi:glycosyltransferase involved in cell wall biosynthesis